MLLLGIDVGTSSIKVSVVDAATQQSLVSVSYPDVETGIIAKAPGWAEQSPAMWWEHVQQAILKAHATKTYNPHDIGSIGISYQMHGLVAVDKDQEVLRDSIIWCDSRAVVLGEKAFQHLGETFCLQHLLNSPGNFTASKLAWVKENEPELFAKIDKIMLPGDYIAMKLTGTISTSISSLSEGVFWDFERQELSKELMDHYGFSTSLIPAVQDVFSNHGIVLDTIAASLGFRTGVSVSYKAGDQPNNALSLNVLEAGEVAATAGTSGVIYGVHDAPTYDPKSRINSFAHVNHTAEQQRIGVLLCINGTGILNRWVRDTTGGLPYQEMNAMAAAVPVGSDGLQVFPFGNGAERMLENKIPGAQIQQLDLNKHSKAHLFRAAQEGIAFAFRYGLDIMRSNNMHPSVIRAGRANMFLSDVFVESFVNTLNVPVELYQCDGSVGAALGAGIGCGYFKTPKEAFAAFKPERMVAPGTSVATLDAMYHEWKQQLEKSL